MGEKVGCSVLRVTTEFTVDPLADAGHSQIYQIICSSKRPNEKLTKIIFIQYYFYNTTLFLIVFIIKNLKNYYYYCFLTNITYLISKCLWFMAMVNYGQLAYVINPLNLF